MALKGTWKAPGLTGLSVSAWGLLCKVGDDGTLDPQPTDAEVIKQMKGHPDYIFEPAAEEPQVAAPQPEAAPSPSKKPKAKPKSKAKPKAKPKAKSAKS